MAELLSVVAGAVAAESVAAVLVPAALSVVVVVSELELHELRASRQAAKRGKEARSMSVDLGKRIGVRCLITSSLDKGLLNL
jgi:hypothetical protein